MFKRVIFILFFWFLLIRVVYSNNVFNQSKMEINSKTDTAIFGGGCFWCIEAVFEQIKGVKKVVSGYAGGTTKNPTYGLVCSGETGHAEVCQILFDPEIISYEKLLLIFFSAHDPTTSDRQGPDTGTQYRSVLFYYNEEQKNAAEKIIKILTEQKVFKEPIVTQVVPYSVFYPAENYHQQYYQNNTSQPYCRIIINPKLEKIKEHFSEYLK